MKHIVPLLVSLLLCLFLASCAPRLAGTWTVQKYENVAPGQAAVTLGNIGTMTFKKNNTGQQNVHYSLFGAPRDMVSGFTWQTGENVVSIKSNDSEFSKNWIVVEDKKNHQLWKSTDSKGQIQTLELSR